MVQHNAIIEKAVKENPHNEGSIRQKIFDQIRSGMSVGKFLDKGGKMSDLNHMVEKGYVRIKSGKQSTKRKSTTH